MEFFKITLTTPALLFPAISLLLLAYTNRFLAIANLIRKLHADFKGNPNEILKEQIQNLRTRVNLIRFMQASGTMSLLLCVVCMFLIFTGNYPAALFIFGSSLILLIASLTLSVIEIQISIKALNIQLRDIEEMGKKNN